MYFPFSGVLVAALLAKFALCQVLSPQGLPNWSTVNVCIQEALGYDPITIDDPYIGENIGCNNWECICSSLNYALPVLSSAASSFCSGITKDIAQATLALENFCAQLTVTPTFASFTASPTAPPTATATSTGGNAGGGNAGACIFGANASDNQCNENANTEKSSGAYLNVPHFLLFGCITVVAGLVLLGWDDPPTYVSNAENNN